MRFKLLSLLFLIFTINVMGQGIITGPKPKKTTTVENKSKEKIAKPRTTESKCSQCGKVLSRCQYNGHHPSGFEVSFACTTPEAKTKLIIDGVEYGEANGKKYLSVGTHKMKVVADEYEDFERSITVDSPSNVISFAMTKKTYMHNGHRYVDLGLSVMWATCNIGADNMQDTGGYYAWGETSAKDKYEWSNYKHCYNGYPSHLTKYCISKHGEVDNTYTLQKQDDVASVQWGGTWRMPTEDEYGELLEKCTHEWGRLNGEYGMMFTSRINGKQLFLPAAGSDLSPSVKPEVGKYGCYWTRKVSWSKSYQAHYLKFDSGGCYRSSEGTRSYGYSVRAVCPK